MSTISHAKERKRFAQLLSEAPTWVAILTSIVAFVLRDSLYANLTNYPRTALIFGWLFGATAYGVFGVLRHADAVAEKLGEPSGTLVLTLSVIAIEVAMMSTIMLHGADNPTLARDAMFATLMIVLNGLVGFALLLGALPYWEQEYNLEGARAFLVVIACLSVFALIIPNYTVTPPDPIVSPSKAELFAVTIILFYGVFLVIQTVRHRAFFAEPKERGRAYDSRRVHKHGRGALSYHVCMLLITLIAVLLLSKFLGVLVDLGIEQLGMPAELGGVAIAILVLSPEGLSALRAAALENQLQRAVNICLGSALATVGLTIPAVLAIGLSANLSVHLGLDAVQQALLICVELSC